MARHITGTNHEIKASDDRNLYAGFCGEGDCVLNVGSKMAATISGNQIKISDGVLVADGDEIVINYGEYDTFELPDGVTGVTTTYYIGYKLKSSYDEDEECEQFISTTAVSRTNLREGYAESYVPLYKVVQEGTSISSATALFTEEMNMDDIRKSNEWTSGSGSWNGSYVSGQGTCGCFYNDKLCIVHAPFIASKNIPAGTTIATLPVKDTVSNGCAMFGRNGTAFAVTTVGVRNGSLYANGAISSGMAFELMFVYVRS